MTTHESDADQSHLDDRVALTGEVDFTMMYAAHDAFSRQLARLLEAGRGRKVWSTAERTRWATFTTQLHVHHRAEDDALWPPLRATDLQPDEIATLDAMELEHAQLDPQLEDVDRAIAADNPLGLAVSLERLSAGLDAHMRHEENSALPLIAEHLGRAGWKAFTDTFRETQGIRGAATYFPWLLDGAPGEIKAKVLGILPPPARLLYRAVWAPRYRRSHN